jgi:hypothetical protein
MNELSLQPDLGIEHVAELRAALARHFDDAGPIALARDRVERVHTAWLLLLPAYIRDRSSAGRATTISPAPPAVVAAARVLALAASLGLGSQADRPDGPEHTGDPA